MNRECFLFAYFFANGPETIGHKEKQPLKNEQLLRQKARHGFREEEVMLVDIY